LDFNFHEFFLFIFEKTESKLILGTKWKTE